MSPKRIERRFNLIEVTLAVAVLGFSAAGIFGLLSLALRTSTESIAYNYAGGAAGNFLSYLEFAAHQNWNTTVDSISEARANSATINAATPDYSAPLFSDIYSSDTDGVFFVRQANGDNTDFSACAAIWKSPVSMALPAAGGAWTTLNMDYSQAVALNVELSWPAEKPYEARRKEFMQIEVFP